MSTEKQTKKPRLTLGIPFYGQTLELKENSATPFDEPQIWIDLTDKTSLEITHETEGLAERDRFYSVRHHCSSDDFDNDKYVETCGVISSVTCANLTALVSEIDSLLRRLCSTGVQPVIDPGHMRLK